jgi:hypothetical protein
LNIPRTQHGSLIDPKESVRVRADVGGHITIVDDAEPKRIGLLANVCGDFGPSRLWVVSPFSEVPNLFVRDNQSMREDHFSERAHAEMITTSSAYSAIALIAAAGSG